MSRVNRIGPRTKPCRIPEVNGMEDGLLPSKRRLPITMAWVLLVRYDLNQFTVMSVTAKQVSILLSSVMIDGIKGCRKIQKEKTCHFLVFKSLNEICPDLEKGSFHTVKCTEGDWWSYIRPWLSMWSTSWVAVAHSVSLLMYPRLDTGLKFLCRRTRLAFFRSYLTRASFKDSEKILSLIEMLMISSMISIVDVRVCLSKLVGIGSRSQLLLGVDRIIISSLERLIGWNSLNCCIPGGAGISIYCGRCWCFSVRLVQIFAILSMKKSLNLSASSWLV